LIINNNENNESIIIDNMSLGHIRSKSLGKAYINSNNRRQLTHQTSKIKLLNIGRNFINNNSAVDLICGLNNNIENLMVINL